MTAFASFTGLFELTAEHESITICPRHRDIYGIRWTCGKTRCCIQKELSGHSSLPPKGNRSVNLFQAKVLAEETGKVIHVGSRKFLPYNLKLADLQGGETLYLSIIEAFFFFNEKTTTTAISIIIIIIIITIVTFVEVVIVVCFIVIGHSGAWRIRANKSNRVLS